ncbi:spore germination protein (amino acid permease) [Defluviitalea raffinosedens]|nr:spore germination protein (amino acid permease) [Defluviitalea raffinosedens]
MAFVLMGTTIVSLKSYPTLLTRSGGRDTWIAFIFSSVLIFLYAWFMFASFKKTNCYNLHKIYCGAVGKFLGNFFMILFGLTLFLTLLESASVEAHSMHTNMLLETPTWYIALFFVLPAIYTLKKGRAAIMITTIISIVLIIFSGITLALLTFKCKKLYYLLPILRDGITPGLIKSFFQSIGLYGCLTISFPYIEDLDQKKNLVKHELLSMLFIIQIEIVAIIGIITTFDIRYLNTMAYPKLLQTQLVDFAHFLESGEFFVMLQIIGGWYIKYILTFYALTKVLHYIKLHDPYVLYTISLLVLIGAISLSQNIIYLFKYLHYFAYICLFNFVVVPFMMVLIYRIRKKTA